jgi:hypothetical protein
VTNRTFRNLIWLLAGLWTALIIAAFVERSASAQALPACAPLGTVTPIPWDEARLTWTLPTANTDGSALSPNTVITTVYRRTGTSGAFVAQCATSAGAVGASLLSQPVGAQNYVVTARVGTGPESAQSNVAIKNIVVVPNPPTGLTVQSDLTAWVFEETENRAFLLPVGTVTAGTQCDPEQSVTIRGQTLNVVPRDSVTFAPGARPQVVFASCG